MEFINRLTDTTDKNKIIADLLQGLTGSFDLAVLFISPAPGRNTKISPICNVRTFLIALNIWFGIEV